MLPAPNCPRRLLLQEEPFVEHRFLRQVVPSKVATHLTDESVDDRDNEDRNDGAIECKVADRMQG